MTLEVGLSFGYSYNLDQDPRERDEARPDQTQLPILHGSQAYSTPIPSIPEIIIGLLNRSGTVF